MSILKTYDFTLTAGGAFSLPVGGAYVRVLSCTGNVSVIGDTFGKLGPISRGQGLENTPYGRLTIIDESGAPNTGTILVSEANFIDQTLYGSISLAGAVALDAGTILALGTKDLSAATLNTLNRPLLPTGSWSSGAQVAANTPLTIFTPAANTNGAIIHMAEGFDASATANFQSFIAKSSAPTSPVDGEIICQSYVSARSDGSGTSFMAMKLKVETRIAAGLGFYFISIAAGSTSQLRSARYTLL